jgi:hypothetical protein
VGWGGASTLIATLHSYLTAATLHSFLAAHLHSFAHVSARIPQGVRIRAEPSRRQVTGLDIDGDGTVGGDVMAEVIALLTLYNNNDIIIIMNIKHRRRRQAT